MTAEPRITTELPFSNFAPAIIGEDDLRRRINIAYRRAERDCVRDLLDLARVPAELKSPIADTTIKLVKALRAKHTGSGMEGLVHEYSLSSEEGVALMCLAEALLRIPDPATRDALIRDKISGGDWRAHLGDGRSLFVNAATWGLVITRKLTSTVDDRKLSNVLTKLIGRFGEPIIRQGVDMAMRLMGEQFVAGETIGEALKNARPKEKIGFRYSYDMLGEAAMTAGDAERYYKEYEAAIHAVGKGGQGGDVYTRPGISIKLSALHPRYVRAQSARVMTELLPRVKTLTALARSYDIGINIDAEEADRLELSLNILEALCMDEDFKGWNGIGFVVQAYGKRAPLVLDWIIELGRRSGHRIMVRLVKGAYWDAEIKRAQVDGLMDYPVFTRKVHTDVSYLACSRKLLDARDAVFPQFATHNAQTLSSIYHLAGPDFKIGDYEFQCLHGMGEPLYNEVVGKAKLDRPCRVYAPVGTHETLLAYLVRRLLENGANASFVNRIADKKIAPEELAADPVAVVEAMADTGAPHELISRPSAILGPDRENSHGLDLSDETALAELAWSLQHTAETLWQSRPVTVHDTGVGAKKPVLNPADHNDVVGEVAEATPEVVQDAVAAALDYAPKWAGTTAAERAAMLDAAADVMQSRIEGLMGIVMREAGKTAANAIGEVREAIDFMRYYAEQARGTFGAEQTPLGPIVCISPWNFPLAIFTGQVSAALAAGNVVLAKPAEETPLIAAEAVHILHEAGIPLGALQFLPGDGRIGAALTAAEGIEGVMFTGSTEVAKLIQKQLAKRTSRYGKPIPFIAETGGQNAMIVDSSALAEQVVADVIASAFDSAGQRCSALRVLCLQEEIADRTLNMLKGAMRELSIGNTERLSTDIGPVIHAEAQETINRHINAMKGRGFKVEQFSLPDEAGKGTFVAPTIVEINHIGELGREVFGPVLHVVRFKQRGLGALIDTINATGYGLTFGLHTRLDKTIDAVSQRVAAGNIYINRNIIGAVVGVQPFGGRGLSGTGPKAGGPLYLGRLTGKAPAQPALRAESLDAGLGAFANWLETNGFAAEAKAALEIGAASNLGVSVQLPGPVGERDTYSLHPRGRILILPQTRAGLIKQIASGLSTGNDLIVLPTEETQTFLNGLPSLVQSRMQQVDDWRAFGPYAGVLIEGDAERVADLNMKIASLDGPIPLVQAATSYDLEAGQAHYCLDWLVEEVSISVNTAAAGGNASLMAIG
ncbi:trifunctional transcriptional regulator/proline dehydrogenase/L-glutamate gamma-semialdehyde dehydrogenase [Rhizobium sp. L1K21]|uniref:trifunctional transcriptional regulator/proline dehydrogenase/L-glutamate gamma-semialdehyde dehydrogenase n=1 Tax=Rhizobium sp. L1K21 TaxID=2954933 RepID=UPI0020929E15|nr:trifunctional transcriptional regulator/proline dehydrogenase/L-glutamate gamma-semialdehyde dehydrogenase [Rhizobium sp. L1K21]MCO6187475.1 trifunctional transcriptional regulator/proline dehydrogenase/L-glutamate gamma-semialdehyde dehydrogenase [Rhizobium sp. L1K21]